VLGELRDRVAAVAQHALVAVDVGDAAAAGGRVHEGRVVGEQPLVVGGVGLDLLEVRGLDGAIGDGDLVGLAGSVVGDGQRVSHGGSRRGGSKPGGSKPGDSKDEGSRNEDSTHG